MAEQDQAQSTSKQLMLQKIYIKDFSFESPQAPDVFATSVTPQTQLNIRSSARQVSGDAQEVTLTLTVEAKDEDRTLFLIELEQAGVFVIQGYTPDEQQMLVGSYCPGTLYPFAREAISDMVSRGGFPQLLLQPINFDALYAQALRERQQRNGGEPVEIPPQGH
ncbi:MAG: protein-export chaperone SecB [Rhodospirillaceae bacterium]|nr:protein-export chaperone SecB [Rhodospirillaceae bacterium]MDE0361776.1 protein-export chaperone SecB [Rhodospirillaceae bacterium]